MKHKLTAIQAFKLDMQVDLEVDVILYEPHELPEDLQHLRIAKDVYLNGVRIGDSLDIDDTYERDLLRNS